ncbi:MAG: hypothetical protein U0230_17165 [Polyangiales bacterium]
MPDGFDEAVVLASEELTCVQVGPVFITHFHGPISAEVLSALAEARRPRMVHDGRSTASLTLVEGDVPIPGQREMLEATKVTMELEAGSVCDAVVLLGGGVFATAARLVLNATVTRVRTRPHRFFHDIRPASEWAASYFPDDFDLRYRVEEACVRLRNRSRYRTERPVAAD